VRVYQAYGLVGKGQKDIIYRRGKRWHLVIRNASQKFTAEGEFHPPEETSLESRSGLLLMCFWRTANHTSQSVLTNWNRTCAVHCESTSAKGAHQNQRLAFSRQRDGEVSEEGE
jgi:hypothetical protein